MKACCPLTISAYMTINYVNSCQYVCVHKSPGFCSILNMVASLASFRSAVLNLLLQAVSINLDPEHSKGLTTGQNKQSCGQKLRPSVRRERYSRQTRKCALKLCQLVVKTDHSLEAKSKSNLIIYLRLVICR